MAYNYEYPYTDMDRVNSDWILHRIKTLSEEMRDFALNNQIEFHDPIAWNITTNYPKLRIVKNGDIAYLSKKAVPYGVDISNTEYWLEIGVFGTDGEVIRENIATNEEIRTMSSKNLPKGSWLWLNDKFYEVIDDIAIGDEFIEDTNIAKTTVEEIVKKRIEMAISGFKIYDNVESMKEDATLTVNALAWCRGYYNADDGGNGTFIIKDTEDTSVLCHALDNGLYAVNIDNDFLLPRYGGYYVNEMMDNARPFMTQHQWKHIILPPANKNHPGCDHYVEVGKNVYFWCVDAPVLFDETLAFSNIDIYDMICCAKTATNLEAIFKVSDANKPEDIYFNTHVSLGGYHFGGVVVEPTHGILIEGCARFNFQYLQVGFCKNGITLGGSGANNTVDLFINQLEFGSTSVTGINATGAYSTILHCNTMLYQNPRGNNLKVLKATGNIYNWYIGDFAFNASGASVTGLQCFDFEGILGNVLPEDTLYIGNARMGGTTIGTFSGGGWVCIDKLIGGVDLNAKLTVSGLMRVVINSAGFRLNNNQWEIDTSGATDEAVNVYIGNVYPEPTITGKNVVINGVCTNGSIPNKVRLLNALLLNTSTNELKIRIGTTDYPIS